MKAPSVRDFSVFSHLGNLGPLQWTNFHIRSLEENFEKIREFHWKNLFITYFCMKMQKYVINRLRYKHYFFTYSLAKVSPWK